MVEEKLGYDPTRLLTVILGVIGTLITAGIVGMVAMLIAMGNRLSSIETTIHENREVRMRTDMMLDRRIERLEAATYVRRNNGEIDP